MRAVWFGLFGSILTFSTAFATPAVPLDQLFDNASDGSPLIALLHNAKKSIDVEIYTMKDPNVIAELKTAMGRGVHLRIIQTPNPVMDSCPVFKPNEATTPADCLNLRAFVKYVNDNGGQYIPFSFDLCGKPGSSCYQHGKVVIVDQASAEDRKMLVSTGNFDPTNLCDIAFKPDHCNRDFSVVTTDSTVISTLQNIFEKDLLGKTYDIAHELQGSDRLTASPLSMDALVKFIGSAQHTLQIENQYLYDPTLNAAIEERAKKGVKVFVMVASVSSFGRLNPTDDASKIAKWKNAFKEFDGAGINSKIFDDHMKVNGKSGYLHAKTILVDGAHAWVGSVNGSTMSLTRNREYGIFSDDPDFVKHLSSVMTADFMNPMAETWKQSLACKNDSCSHASAGSPEEESPDETPDP